MADLDNVVLTKEDMEALADYCADYSKDPLGFVETAFPWGEKNSPLENQDGADIWQREILEYMGEELRKGANLGTIIRTAIASGHGIGKSALVAWIILWGISTFEDTRGVVTANTATQLETKTWAELSKWYAMCITKPLFKWTATSIYSVQDGHEKTWRIDAIPWSMDRPEAFAGLHNKGKRIIVVYDEASAIDDKIWEVTEGAMTDTDTEIIWLAFGNPTRLQGKFHDCFTTKRHRWNGKQIDSRTTKMANKVLFKQWEEDYGEDSDFFKVRVRGQFPSSGDLQLISSELVTEATKRYKNLRPENYNFAPVIFGVDPAWEGDDLLVAYMRQGNYSKVLFSMKKNSNDMEVAGKLADLQDQYNMLAGNIDLGYGQGIYSALKTMGRGDKWSLIAFGSTKTELINVFDDQGKNKDTISVYENKRAEMWYKLRDWLKEGGCVEDKPEITNDLTAPNGFINPNSGKYILESKKDMKARGVQSPNYGDALALTFARPVVSEIYKSIKYRKAKLDGKLRKYGSL